MKKFREPLISLDGFIFDKEAILNYILDQKKNYKNKLKIWEQQIRLNNDKLESVFYLFIFFNFFFLILETKEKRRSSKRKVFVA